MSNINTWLRRLTRQGRRSKAPRSWLGWSIPGPGKRRGKR